MKIYSTIHLYQTQKLILNSNFKNLPIKCCTQEPYFAALKQKVDPLRYIKNVCFHLLVTVGCLILHQRYRKRFERYMHLAQDVSSTFNQTSSLNIQAETSSSYSTIESNKPNRIQNCGSLPTIKEGCCEESPVVDIEDILSPTRSKPDQNA